jgi:GDP-L-fucose synthase
VEIGSTDVFEALARYQRRCRPTAGRLIQRVCGLVDGVDNTARSGIADDRPVSERERALTRALVATTSTCGDAVGCDEELDLKTDSLGADHVNMLDAAGLLPRNARIFVAGHRGLVGSALVRRLLLAGFTDIVAASREQLDLRDQAAVNYWFKDHRPDYVFLAAGTVGGILANSTRPAEFLYDNLMIHSTVIDASYRYGVTKLLYLGSSCIYPRHATQPIDEDQLLTGALEPTNEAYAVAKIAGIKLCRSYREQYGCNFISAMPTNLYGPGDNFDLASSHVVPAMLRRFHEARSNGDGSVTVWGSGSPRREFLHVDDLADACLFLMATYDDDTHVNVGTGADLSIAELAETIRDIVYPSARIHFDQTKPDGMPRKLLDVSKLTALGWHPSIPFRQGLEDTYAWYREHHHQVHRTSATAA